MNAEMQTAQPKKSEHAAKVKAASILAGRPVGVSRGGTSKSAVNKRMRDAADVAAGAAEALDPKNVKGGLDMVGSGARMKRAKLRAEEAEEAKKKRRAEAAEAAEAAAAAATAGEEAAEAAAAAENDQEQRPGEEEDENVVPETCGCCRPTRSFVPEDILAGGGGSGGGGDGDGAATGPSSTSTRSSSSSSSGIILEVELEKEVEDVGIGTGSCLETCTCTCGREDEGDTCMEQSDPAPSSRANGPMVSPPEAPKPPPHFHLDEVPAHLSPDEQEEYTIWQKLDQTLADRMVQSTPEDRRMFLAAFTEHPKPAMERVLRITITDKEWNKAKKHARYPGPYKAAKKTAAEAVFKSKVDDRLLQKFCRFLEGPGVLQRYAFGEAIIELCGGSAHVAIDNVDRLQDARTLTSKFLLSVDAEVMAEGRDELLPDENRCRCVEKDTLRRCMHQRGHKEAEGGEQRCKFTPDGSLGRTTVLALVNTFTGNDIKKLSGLDDTRVLKGRDNFERARRVAKELYDPKVMGVTDEAEKQALRDKVQSTVDRIDSTETFYKTEWYSHVESQAEHGCCCLECGFYDAKGLETIDCPKYKAGQHLNSCNKCTDMYGLIRELEAAHAVAAKREGLSQEQENEIEQLEQDLVDIKSDLDDYRSHLARQISEDAFDEEEIKNLPDDTARVTSDWKHKILECYFRENMLKYFGKRGICMIGFMLMWNSTDPEEKARGVSTTCRV